MSVYINGNAVSPFLKEMVIIDLDSVEVYIGDYLDSATQTVEYGAIDKYQRQLVS